METGTERAKATMISEKQQSTQLAAATTTTSPATTQAAAEAATPPTVSTTTTTSTSSAVTGETTAATPASEATTTAAKATERCALHEVTENNKGWLIYGFILFKVLIPAIRPFVERNVQMEYKRLKTSHSIHTQTRPGRRVSWVPYMLKYENINANHALPRLGKGKCDYSKFDYRVTSHVDFAKLFLENHMAKFNSFDEHCEASAILSLLCKVPIFSSAVKKASDDVKTSRNKWAHCVFSDWDPLKFQKRFDEMEKLTKELGLPPADENSILKELNDWKTKGKILCMNATVDPDLLKVVNDLKTNVEQLSFEVQEDRERVSHALENMSKEIKTRLDILECGHLATNQQLSTLKGSVVSIIEILENQSGILENHSGILENHNGILENQLFSSLKNYATTRVPTKENGKSDDRSSDKQSRGMRGGVQSEVDFPAFEEFKRSSDYYSQERLVADAIIYPNWAYLEGGESFYIEFRGKLPDEVIQAWAEFDGKPVRMCKTYDGTFGDGDILHGREIPARDIPGSITVPIKGRIDNQDEPLGEVTFHYEDQDQQTFERLRKSRKCECSAQLPNCESQCENWPEDEASNTECFSDYYRLSHQRERSQQVQFLRDIIYKAAELGFQRIIEAVLNSSAGPIVFESYSNEPNLPEDVAEAHGHEEVAAYIRDITKRFAKGKRTSQTPSRHIDWQELVRAVEQCEVQSGSLQIYGPRILDSVSEEDEFRNEGLRSTATVTVFMSDARVQLPDTSLDDNIQGKSIQDFLPEESAAGLDMKGSFESNDPNQLTEDCTTSHEQRESRRETEHSKKEQTKLIEDMLHFTNELPDYLNKQLQIIFRKQLGCQNIEQYPTMIATQKSFLEELKQIRDRLQEMMMMGNCFPWREVPTERLCGLAGRIYRFCEDQDKRTKLHTAQTKSNRP